MKSTLESFCNSLQEKDRKEVTLYTKENESVFDCVCNVLKGCDYKCFVSCNGDIIAIVAYKIHLEQGYKIATLCVLTSSCIKNHVKEYIVSAKRFIEEVSSVADLAVSEIIEGYTSTLKMAEKLGFKKISEYNRKDSKLFVYMLKGASYGMDR